MLRAVLDTNIVVSACLVSEGAPATIVELALLGTFTLCISPDVLAEYQEVLVREKFARHKEKVKTLLEGIQEIALSVTPEHRLTISPDEDDNRVLECAEAAQADVLVTGNRKHFPQSLGKIRIVSAREFLTELDFSAC
jgi:putative PIN family toxin of toxin-antitoxin system